MTPPKLSSRRLALVSGLAFLAVVGGVSVCDAESPWRRPIPPRVPPPYRLSLRGADGEVLPTFRHAGTTFVLGEPGERYDIRIENPTAERVEVVVTVDGRDAISGEVGDYVTQRGYLIEPWGTLVVEGFRRSLQEVAAFRFTGRGGSYSALRGTPQHVGVIGVAVFPEKPRPPAPLRKARRRSAPPPEVERELRPAPSAPRAAEGAGAAPRSKSSSAERAERWDLSTEEAAPGRAARGSSSGPSNIGTEYGETQSSSVMEVGFERRSPTHPVAVLRVRYDDYDGLAARGIDLSSLDYAYHEEPEPFPYSRSRFAPPPR